MTALQKYDDSTDHALAAFRAAITHLSDLGWVPAEIAGNALYFLSAEPTHDLLEAIAGYIS